MPWQTLPWNGSVPLSQNQVEHSMKINMAMAQALCPQLCTHMHLLDSKEFWTSRDFIRRIAQMQSPGHLDPTVDFSHGDDVGAFFFQLNRLLLRAKPLTVLPLYRTIRIMVA